MKSTFAPRLFATLFLLTAFVGCQYLLPGSCWASSHETLEMGSLLQKGLDELVELEVSLATGTAKPLKLAPSVATVITAMDLERLGITTLDEALETVPGLHVLPSATNIFTSTWVIRGIYSQLNPHVLLLINGQPMRHSVNGNKPHTFRMPVAMISRIEIIRGPGSAVHGADAFAGAINVITKSGAELDGTYAGARIGSFDTQEYMVSHGGSYAGWEVAAGVEYQRGDGDNGRVIERDALGSGPPSLAPGHLDTHYEGVTANLSVKKKGLTSRLFYNEILDNGHGPGINQTLTRDGFSKGRLILGSLNYMTESVLPDFDVSTELRGSYNWLENYFRFLPQDYRNMIGNPGAKELNGSLELAGDYRGLTDHRLRVIAGVAYYDTRPYQRKNFGPGVAVQFGELVDITDTPFVYLEDQHRSVLHAAIQDEWSFAAGWELTAGVRYDNYSDFGGTVNPRLAIVWRTTPELTSKLLYGRAFRPPTFGEERMKNNPATLGNDNLEPETIDSLELAFAYRPVSNLRLGLNLFGYRIDGLIDYVADPSPAVTKTAQNARDQEGRGIEVEADWNVTDTLRLRGNFAYQRSEDRTTGQVVPDAPGMKLNADADWGFLPDWSLSGQYLWIGDRHRAAGDLRPEIADYDLVHLTLRRKNILKHWDLALAVRNLFDVDAREPSDDRIPNDYPMEGRSFWAELRCTF